LLCALAALFAVAAAAQERTGDTHIAHSGELSGQRTAASSNPHGIVVDFELLDRYGNTVTEEDFRGRYVLLGFGFTHCAHICPMMALNMGRAIASANTDAAGIFISVDTERDSVAATDEYASKFGEAMMGLGGSIEQINAAAKNFKVSYAVTKTQNTYTVQHTSNVYLIDPQGQLIEVFTFNSSPGAMLEAMR
jgi:protein SCO1/2